MAGRLDIIEFVKAKGNVRDYYGNLPIFYTMKRNDDAMISQYYNKRDMTNMFEERNFKLETIFHVAAKNDSVEAFDALMSKYIFIEHLLKRDFKGDTPLHTAAKAGSFRILKYLLSAVTPAFLQMRNDFEKTPL